MCRNSIWTISILAMFLLSGCAPSTQDLIEQARLSGDWSLVNKSMEAIERNEARRPQSCPRGTNRSCIGYLGDEKCECINNSDFQDMLRSLGL